MKIDIVILTKNSEETLDSCLNSIYKNIPVNRVIVIDGYSTDSTIKILDTFNEKYGNITLIRDEGTRGRSRQRGIEEVETRWFMFVDSDAILCDKWFDKANKFMKEDVGAIWGMEILSAIKNSKLLKLFKQVNMKNFETRGGTHDLLIRYEAVKDIHIPHQLHTFEDAYIKEWITKKGYTVIATYDPYCIHRKSRHVWNVKTSISNTVNEIRCGLLTKYPRLIPVDCFYLAYFVYQILRTNVLLENKCARII